MSFESSQIWVAGYHASERKIIAAVVEESMSWAVAVFATGEQLLTELSARFAEGAGPELIILDTRMPLINGINTAIALRAFELGAERPKKIPIAFFGNAPPQDAFQKVIKFCSPAVFMPTPLKPEEFRYQALKLVASVRKSYFS